MKQHVATECGCTHCQSEAALPVAQVQCIQTHLLLDQDMSEMTVAYIVDHCGELFQGHCRHFTIHDCDFELAFLDWLRISVTMPFYWKGYPKVMQQGSPQQKYRYSRLVRFGWSLQLHQSLIVMELWILEAWLKGPGRTLCKHVYMYMHMHNDIPWSPT